MRLRRNIAVVCAGMAAALAIHAGSAAAAQAPSPLAWPQKVDSWVLTEAADGPAEFLVFLTEQANLSGAELVVTQPHKGRFVFERLRATADRTQGPLLALLKARGVEHRPFWVANMVWVKGDLALVEELARRPDVARVNANPRVHMQEPLEAEPDEREPQAIEPGVNRVRAPQVWTAGFTGQTVVIGGQDTGYDWDHPALVNKYRGWNGSVANHNYNWHDAIHSGGGVCGADSDEPCDDGSHGTHTMGTMVGDDGGTNQVGVAPGARWIGCRNMDEGDGTPATYSECFQWFIAPTDLNDANPDPTKAPHVINNSWSCPPSEGCTDPNVLLTVVNNTRAAGIVVVVSAGNSGSGCSTVNTPAAIYDSSFSVGATNNSNDNIASFSSRGPVTIDGSNRLKPNISAPGVSIRSSVPGGGYSSAFSGTSMAGPHVAGVVALLMSAEPALKGQVDQVETILEATAAPPGTTTQTCGGIPGTQIPNNTYGFGRVDALNAVTANLGVSSSAWPARVLSGQTLTHTVTVSNQGPLAATLVTLQWTLPQGDLVVDAIPSQGDCDVAGVLYHCSLGTIANGGAATVEVTLLAGAAGTMGGRAIVDGDRLDLVSANDHIDLQTVVEACPPATPAITAPLSAPPGATGLTASVPNQSGHTYDWTLTGGTITGGQGTAQITFTAGGAGATMSLSVVDTVLGCASAAGHRNVQVHFLDVPPSHVFHDQVNTLARNQVTAGCGGGNYCPAAAVTRAQMAVFLLVSKEGPSYTPPSCVTPVFADVPCSHPFAAWVNELAARGISGGCGNGNYCPAAPVTRAQMAVFLLSTKEPPGYMPPACTAPQFDDVPCSHPFAAWVNELASRGITGGCGGTSYCPAAASTRGQMAVFLVSTFGLN
jgi:serine protease AprX